MLKITEGRRAEVRRHSVDEFPRECCGILLGRVEGERIIVLQVVATSNVAEATRLRDRYVVDPMAIVRADRIAHADGMDVVGFYHSHPDHPAMASETDRQQAWEGYVYLIVAVTREGAGELRAWMLQPDGAMREVPVSL